MKLPIYNELEDNKLEYVELLDCSEIGIKQSLYADTKKAIGVLHTMVTGNPHPRFLIIPEGATIKFEKRADHNIYIICNKEFQIESQHSCKGPYEITKQDPNKETWISGTQTPFVTWTKEFGYIQKDLSE